MKKLLAFLEVHSESDAEKKRLERWKNQHLEVLGFVRQRVLGLWDEEEQDAHERCKGLVGRCGRKRVTRTCVWSESSGRLSKHYRNAKQGL